MVKSSPKNAKKSSKETYKVVPLGDRVLLELPTREEKTKAGIIIPETVDQEKPEQGKVIAVGEGRVIDDGKVVPMKVKVGDIVLFSKYGHDEITINNIVHYMLREDAILAVIK